MEKLKKQIHLYSMESRVEWRAFKTNLDEIYEGIDIIAAPSCSPEPFGLIAIEANMKGLPAIVANDGGFKETVEEGYNGFLIDPMCPEEIAGKIEYFYFNRNAIGKMGKKGQQHVILHFDKKTMINKIDKLITDL
jgi:glycosyltransferase involved in cell wall biosynthesis